MKFSELRDHISIIDFAQHYGYSSVTPWAKSKRSRNFPALENVSHNDRIIINRKKNRYTEAGATRSGDLIDFVAKRIAIVAPQKSAMNEFVAVNEILHEYLNISHELNPQRQKPIVKQNINEGFDPKIFIKSKTLREENIDYLKEEGISLSTINDPCFSGKIISVKNPVIDDAGSFKGSHYRYYNVSFPYVLSIGGATVGFEQRNFTYKGHALRSNKDAGIWISNLPNSGVVDTIVVTESAKDCLSYHQLHKPKNTVYVSVGGHVATNQLTTLKNVLNDLKKTSNPLIVAGFDNDNMGALFSLQLLCSLGGEIGTIAPHYDDPDRISLILPVPNKQLSQALNKFNRSIKKEPDYLINRFYSESADGNFVIQIPKQKHHLHILSKSIISAYKITDITVHAPALKDFNDDLKHFINSGKVLTNKLEPFKNTAFLAY